MQTIETLSREKEALMNQLREATQKNAQLQVKL
jgi:hypothetical protein